jgi:hypothetical protein
MISTFGADHNLPCHLPIWPVYLETEHVGRLVFISEPQVEVTDRVGVDECHGDLADSLQVETEGGESDGEEAASSFRVESGMANIIEHGDGHGRGIPQVTTLSVASTA